MSISDAYELTVGLEVHAQLLTRSKTFSSDAVSVSETPNLHAGIITLAHPGTLPVLNREVVELALRMGLACNCRISETITFDRKNYFYPDLPKGYQITQDRNPICKGGFIQIADGKKIRLNRIHLEEDAGKSIHDNDASHSYIDFNRAGTPLIELVTEPCIHSAEEAALFMAEVRSMLRYLNICDGNMEEGSLRADANVSIRKKGEELLGIKVEIKNMNSIRNLKQAIETEFVRQVSLVEKGNQIISETRLFDAATGETCAMRQKEELNDYRYFPEPDISPFILTDELIDKVRSEMPRTGAQFVELLMNVYGLSEYDARVISSEQQTAFFYTQVASICTDYKAISNWVMGPVRNHFNQHPESEISISPGQLAKLIALVGEGKVSYTLAVQKIFPKLTENPDFEPLKVAEDNGWILMNDDGELLAVIRDIIRIYPLKVEEFKNGKKGILAMFMGEVMKRTKGKADPKRASEFLLKVIENHD